MERVVNITGVNCGLADLRTGYRFVSVLCRTIRRTVSIMFRRMLAAIVGVVVYGLIFGSSMGTAAAFDADEARFTNSFEQFAIKIKIVDVDRDQNSTIKGKLYSNDSLAKRFNFHVVGAGKDVELVATLDEQLKNPLELVFDLEFQGQNSVRRYQVNPSSSEPLDGNIGITAQELAKLPVTSAFELNLDETVYVVSEGQSLWDVAADIDSISGNNFQRALAIFATNRHRFTNSDVNQLDRRTVLAIPSQDYINSFDPERSATVFFGVASGQLMIDAFLESAERLATSSSIEIPTEQMILARRVKFLEQQLEELDQKYSRKMRRISQDVDRRLRNLEDPSG